MPSIRVNRAEKKALQRLGLLFRTQNILTSKARGLQRLGCCGDCEQWLLEHWLDIISEIFSKKATKLGEERTKIHGIQELEEVMLKNGCSKRVTRNFVIHLRTFVRKARKAQNNKWGHRPYHFKIA